MIIEIHTEIGERNLLSYEQNDRLVLNEYNYEKIDNLVEIIRALLSWERKKRHEKNKKY